MAPPRVFTPDWARDVQERAGPGNPGQLLTRGENWLFIDVLSSVSRNVDTTLLLVALVGEEFVMVF